jgi:subtilase family serine protease
LVPGGAKRLRGEEQKSNKWRKFKSMKRPIELLVVATAVVLFGFAACLSAQDSAPRSPIQVSEAAQVPVHYPSVPGTLVIPKSSMPQATPAGHKFAAHTNLEFFIPAGFKPDEAPPYYGYFYETPASIACILGFRSGPAGCNPNATVNVPTSGSNSIAIVDAYDDPVAPSDLAWFSLQFGLPLTLTQFQVVQAVTSNSSCWYYPGYVEEDYSGGWEIEEALDIEWSHAMAPKASIYLVEACSNYDTDLQQAVLVANNLVQCGNPEIGAGGVLGTCPGTPTGKGEISMSWGAGEFIGENASDSCATPDDSCFTAANVVYVASSGDSPGVIWPGISPNVVSAGGLSNRRNPATGALVAQSAWVFGGGGQSAIEAQPSYQYSGTNYKAVQAVCGTVYRCAPDVSFDADPYTGVWVYDTFPMYGYVYTWWIVGGTSVSAPSLAGIINSAATKSGTWAASTNAELTTVYNNMTNTSDFANITSGYCGFYMGFTATKPWNFCTGVGSVETYAGK